MKIVTIERGKEVEADFAERRRLEASIAVDANRIFANIERQALHPVDAPDRASVKRAMRSVEAAIVQALWTLARLPDRNPLRQSQHGLGYIQDPRDRFANAVANAGKWDDVRPRPALPSAKAIDAMHGPLEWLQSLAVNHARLVSIAAGTKRGDPERSVSWRRVRDALPETRTQTIRTLQRRYDDGIRQIVARLT